MNVRKARVADAQALWRLANDPVVRANSFKAEPIPYEDHIRWFEEKLASPDCSFWVAEVDGAVAAQVRYDRRGDVGEIGFSVAPEFRGRGIGTQVLVMTDQRACEEMGLARLRGFVFEENVASRRAFEKAGYEMVDRRDVEGRACCVFEREVNIATRLAGEPEPSAYTADDEDDDA